MARPDILEYIEHDGIVQESGTDSVTVNIITASACSACHARGSCLLSEMEQKSVIIKGRYDLKSGDHVTVVMKKSSGYAAVMLGYILPLALVLLVLVILVSLSSSEIAAGLGSLAVLIPYYFILWLFKKRISNKFTFSIKPGR